MEAPRVKGCLDVNWSPFSSLIFEDSCPLCLFPQNFRTMVRPRTRCSLTLLAPQKPSVTLGLMKVLRTPRRWLPFQVFTCLFALADIMGSQAEVVGFSPKQV